MKEEGASWVQASGILDEFDHPAAEWIDRRGNRWVCEVIPSLKTYVLVSQERREVTIHRRADEDWTTECLLDHGDTLQIPEFEFSMTLDAIYAQVSV